MICLDHGGGQPTFVCPVCKISIRDPPRSKRYFSSRSATLVWIPDSRVQTARLLDLKEHIYLVHVSSMDILSWIATLVHGILVEYAETKLRGLPPYVRHPVTGVSHSSRSVLQLESSKTREAPINYVPTSNRYITDSRGIGRKNGATPEGGERLCA